MLRLTVYYGTAYAHEGIIAGLLLHNTNVTVFMLLKPLQSVGHWLSSSTATLRLSSRYILTLTVRFGTVLRVYI